MFGVAILTTAIRIYIRAFKVKQFAIEDGILLWAVVVLCGVTTLCYVALPDLYILINLRSSHLEGEKLLDVFKKLPVEAKEFIAVAKLWSLVLFSIKLAYLFFFRKLVCRLKKLKIWWWCVTIFMVSAESLESSLSNHRRSYPEFYLSTEEEAELKPIGSCSDCFLHYHMARLCP